VGCADWSRGWILIDSDVDRFICSKASLSDDKGLIKMLANHIDYFKAKPVNIPKITILLDNGYHPDKLQEELEKIY